jgi:hypothetical protein
MHWVFNADWRGGCLMTNRDECDCGLGVFYGNVLVLFMGEGKVVSELNE